MITKINSDTYMTSSGIVVLAHGSYDPDSESSVRSKILAVLNDASSNMDEPGTVYDETAL